MSRQEIIVLVLVFLGWAATLWMATRLGENQYQLGREEGYEEGYADAKRWFKERSHD